MQQTVVEFQGYGNISGKKLKGTLIRVLPSGHYEFQFVNPWNPKLDVLYDVRPTDGRLVSANSYGGYEIPKRMLAWLNNQAAGRKIEIPLKEPVADPPIKLPKRIREEERKPFKVKKKVIRTATRPDDELPTLNKDKYKADRDAIRKNTLTASEEDFGEGERVKMLGKKKKSAFVKEESVSKKVSSSSNGKEEGSKMATTITVRMAEGLINHLYESVSGKKAARDENKVAIKELLEDSPNKNNQFHVTLSKKSARLMVDYFDSGVLEDIDGKTMRGVVRISQEINEEFGIKMPAVAKAHIAKVNGGGKVSSLKARKDEEDEIEAPKKPKNKLGKTLGKKAKEVDEEEEVEVVSPKSKFGNGKVSSKLGKKISSKVSSKHEEDEDDAPVKRGPGRPKGSKNKPKEEEAVISKNGKSKKHAEDTSKIVANSLKKAGAEARASKLGKKLAKR